jgi:hypothetical protein
MLIKTLHFALETTGELQLKFFKYTVHLDAKMQVVFAMWIAVCRHSSLKFYGDQPCHCCTEKYFQLYARKRHKSTSQEVTSHMLLPFIFIAQMDNCPLLESN